MFARLAQMGRTSMTSSMPRMTMMTPFQSNQFVQKPMMMTMMPFNNTFAQQNQLLTMTHRCMATMRTYQPSVRRRKAKHGFLRRLKSRGGRHVLTRRREKGRWKIGV